ncbi:Panacea domain-containing protein [Priestia megaterium]|uniref:Panacea domain-containing protein n=1 Tax=Priestia megaterium TaxID=1404 RepID=UPI001CDC2ADD|nr:type II toxin-antitoxin system antitoxin SocA domain-containing protein [Priestia megaterium]MCA4157634.1 DUF4065 domain-containing protein [Priestia megaterium]
MAFHFIAIMSHYIEGSRIAWHYASEERLDKEVINSFFSKVKRKCGEVHFGIHKLSTESTSWKSVVEKDSFFDDVISTEDMDTFVEYVSSDQELSARDVAKFILSSIPVSHLKLQKLLYYCYAEFIQRTGLKLFREPIVSYKYGPVVESIFKEFTVHGSSVIDYEEDKAFVIPVDKLTAKPSFMKIANSEHGLVALDCIIDVLQQYGHKSPFELVDITHQEGGPWARVYKPGQNNIITDDHIIQYHEFAK